MQVISCDKQMPSLLLKLCGYQGSFDHWGDFNTSKWEVKYKIDETYEHMKFVFMKVISKICVIVKNSNSSPH
jgi:hypothetical protein